MRQRLINLDWFRVGGIWFVQLGRFNLSFSVSSRAAFERRTRNRAGQRYANRDIV